MRISLKTLALSGLLIAAPSIVLAQAPGVRGGAMGAGPRDGGVTAILNARRALELTPRQVAQLDSIERSLWAEREKLRAQAQPQREAVQRELRQRIERGERPMQNPAQRDSLRAQAQARMNAMRPQMDALRQKDSTARVAAERLLNDTQRGKWREMQAERRGYERGRREGMRRGGDVRAQGFRGAPRQPGQRQGMAPRGQAPQRPQQAPRRPE